MNKTVKRLIAGVTAAGLICGGIYGGLYAYRSTSKVPVNVYSVGEIEGSTYYYSDDYGFGKSGTVVADRIQSCFLSDTQNVKEVLVTTGQNVKAGEPLYTFDTTLSEIELEKLEIELAQDQLDLKHMQDNLVLINRLRPSSPDDGGGTDDFEDVTDSVPEEPVEEVYDPEPTGRLLYGDGTLFNPYVFLWSFSDIIDADAIVYLFHGGEMPGDPDDGTEEDGGGEEDGDGPEDGQDEQDEEGDYDEGGEGTGEEPEDDNEPVAAFLLRGLLPVSVWGAPLEDDETARYIEDDEEPEFYFEEDDTPDVYFEDDVLPEEETESTVEEMAEPEENQEPVGEEENGGDTAPEQEEPEDPVIDDDTDEEEVFIEEDPDDGIAEEELDIEMPDDVPEYEDVYPDEPDEGGTEDQEPEEITTESDGTGTERPDAAEEETGEEEPSDGKDPESDASSETEEPDGGREEEIDTLIPDENIEVEDDGDDMDVYVVLEIHQSDNSEAPLILKIGLHMFRVSNRISMRLYNPDESPDDGEEDSVPEEFADDGTDDGGYYYYDDVPAAAADGADDGGSGRSDLEIQDDTIDLNASYTAEEIASMRETTEKDIAEMSIKVRVAEIDLREKRKEIGDGTVRSRLDGVVKTVRDPEDAKSTGAAVVQVSGGGGYYIASTVGELELPDLSIGQSVTVTDYESGQEMIGSIDSISEFPSTGNDYGFMEGNPNSSSYGCTIRMDEDVELRDDAWVEVNYSTKQEDTSEGFFIDAMFVRIDPGGNYVYVRNGDGRIEKRIVSTGVSSTDAVQIKGGLSKDEYIAFPYGNDCVPGAYTEVSSLESFYGFT